VQACDSVNWGGVEATATCFAAVGTIAAVLVCSASSRLEPENRDKHEFEQQRKALIATANHVVGKLEKLNAKAKAQGSKITRSIGNGQKQTQ
jgi:hypothetical protein